MGTEEPVAMLLFCTECKRQHVDQIDHVTGIDWSTRPHRTHLCAFCGHLWKPAERVTVGVTSSAFTRIRALTNELELRTEEFIQADQDLAETRDSFARFLLYAKRIAEDSGSQAIPLDAFLEEQAEFSEVEINPVVVALVKKLAEGAVPSPGGGGTPGDRTQTGSE